VLLERSALLCPGSVRHLAVQPTHKQRQVPERVDQLIALHLVRQTTCEGPVRLPLSRHQVFDRVLPSRHPLTA